MAEAPGAQEDATGVPMVGRAGELLNKLLFQVGLSRDECVIMNRVRCRPPRNRLQDYSDAVEACNEWTVKELQKYDPSIVVLMGATAITPIFGATVKVGQVRGTIRNTGEDHSYGKRIWIATYHPAATFRPGGQDYVKWIREDLATARQLLMN